MTNTKIEPENHPLLFGNFSVMNGMRALALFWVVFVHMPTFAVPGPLVHIHNHWRFGVDFFFAISGFLVTRSLYQCYKKRGNVKETVIEYLIRRVARIFPPYYVILAVYAVIALVTRNNFYEQLAQIKHILPSFPLFYANYMIPTVEEAPHTLIILWSVSFQEQFYFLLGLYFLFSRRMIKEMILISGLFSVVLRLVFAFGLWYGQDRSGYYEFWLPFNFDAITWGVLAWLYYDKFTPLFTTKSRSTLTWTLLLIGDALVIAAPSFVGGDISQVIASTFKAPLFALTVRAACELETSQAFFPKFLRGKLLGRIGVASYEIYLLHVLLFGFLEKILTKLHFGNGTVFLVCGYIVVIISGMKFYDVFGKPSQEWMKNTLMGTFGIAKKKTQLAS